MTVLLSIDPGTRVCGAALWRDGRLVAAGLVKNPVKEGSGPRECARMAGAVGDWVKEHCVLVNQLAIEFPQIYPRGDTRTKGDPNDLLPLAAVDGALASMFWTAEVLSGVPHEWKGGIQKPKTTGEPYPIRNRVEARLRPEELARVNWTKNVRHSWDVTDAIGIGLFHIGRFERKRVYAVE